MVSTPYKSSSLLLDQSSFEKNSKHHSHNSKTETSPPISLKPQSRRKLLFDTEDTREDFQLFSPILALDRSIGKIYDETILESSLSGIHEENVTTNGGKMNIQYEKVFTNQLRGLSNSSSYQTI